MINANSNVCLEYVVLEISRDRFFSIEIAQWETDGVYDYYVYIDGKLQVRMQNNGWKLNYTNVNVFTTGNVPGNPPLGMLGQLRNLEMATWHQQPTDCYISTPMCN